MNRLIRCIGLFFLLVVASACNSTEQTLDVSSSTNSTNPPVTAVDPANTQPVSASSGTSATANAFNSAQNPSATLTIAPIVGASVKSVPPLSQRMVSTARDKNIRITTANDPNVRHVLKGYFSALSEGGNTTVIYVWDVFDRNGNRLHRIQGQEKRPGTSGDGWSSVSPDMMRTIADKTMNEYAQWAVRT